MSVRWATSSLTECDPVIWREQRRMLFRCASRRGSVECKRPAPAVWVPRTVSPVAAASGYGFGPRWTKATHSPWFLKLNDV